jgi:hypothetical protein
VEGFGNRVILQVGNLKNHFAKLPNKNQVGAGSKMLVPAKSEEAGTNEGSGISKEDLRQVQDRAP